MSLFDYAQEVVSRKLERKSPMLTISMGMEPVMPMAQGGGLSTVQNSLNINGQPHRLAYINPSEESLLQQLGGSGRKIDGIPTYDIGDDGGPSGSPDDSIGDDGGPAGSPDDGPDDGSGDQGGITTDTNEEGLSTFGGNTGGNTGGNPDTFDIDSLPDISFDPNDPNFSPYYSPPEVFAQRDKDNLSPNKSFNVNPLAAIVGLFTHPVIGKAVDDLNIGPTFSVNVPGTATKGGYGDTGTGSQGGSGKDGPDNDADTDAGGDDIIIREKIAAVKQVPVEEVTVEEVKRAKRLTAAQRVTGTRLEDILDQIYGSGKGAGLLGITTNNTGTA